MYNVWRLKNVAFIETTFVNQQNKFNEINLRFARRLPCFISRCYKFCALVLFTATSRVCPKRFEKPPLRDEKK
jgi:hypothetical protein